MTKQGIPEVLSVDNISLMENIYNTKNNVE